MGRVAILTLFYRNYNYGGVLQGYALKKTIEKESGNTVDILRYKDGKNPIYSNVIEQSKQYGFKAFFSKIFEKILEKCSFIINRKIGTRFAKFDQFIDECVNKDGVEYTDDNISQTLEKYDTYISGSDQVWNPNCIRNGFLQAFVPENKTKVSYAASIGRSRLSDKELSIMAPQIEKFDYISVRENTAKNILENKINKNIKVVCDPVFLLDKDEWDIDEPVEGLEPDKYILFYSFSNSKKYRNKVKKICEENGKELVYIPYAKQKFNLYDNKGPGQKLFDIGPKEFVWLIKNANCIYTDSFHGTALSIIFRKNFFVFERDSKKNNTSMNSRIYDLLNKVDLRERIISDIKNNNIDIDYNIIDINLSKYIENSLEYLKKALS